MSDYLPTIGLEIHAELKTRTKMFCDSKNDPDEKRPNVNICPVCMGHPGTLPVINKEAVKHVLKVGLAVNGTLADFTEFDRKNYFYPDIPKGYQISQYKYPLVSGGELNGVKITRVHIEEDTGTSLHDEGGGAGHSGDKANGREGKAGTAKDRSGGNYSLLNYNRAGVPLMELVTEPVIHSAEEAASFAKELQLVLRYLVVAEANMEKGEMRVEANISVSKDPKKFGTKVEVKNLNSFKAVERAIKHEVKRHIEILEGGGKIVQETRGWNETTETTFPQRQKEDSHDYRYFPDPDLPKLQISEIPEFQAAILKKEIGELPAEKRARYKKDYDLKTEDIEMFIANDLYGNFFQFVVDNLKGSGNAIKLAANYIASDIAGLVKRSGIESAAWLTKNAKESASAFAKLVLMIGQGKINSRGAKDILAIMYEKGGDPEKIAAEKGLLQKNDEGELKKAVEKIIAENGKSVADYKAGKEVALQFLVGQGMKATKGAANPETLKKLFKEQLS
jgi:aspartyl-tRNA(Asn)/glutamyl-tRNA(Gln) amidotransferase subunit B